jgi:signal transduction histidine kinase
MSDLITNAWKAESANIRVAVTAELQDGGWISIMVEDDGSGIPPGVLSDPRSSLHVLENRLRQFGGTVAFTAGAARGTRACARWRSLAS